MVAWLALGLALGLVEVDGPPCPGAEAVHRRLVALLPADFDDSGRHARLSREPGDGGRLRVELLDPSGHSVVLRHLDATAGCDDLAAAAAVVLAAAWTAPGPNGLAGEQGGPEQAPIEFARKRPPPPPPIPVDLGGAFVASFAGLDAAAGAGFSASAAPRGYRLGVRLAFVGTAPRDQPLGSGTVSYTRLAFALGPRYRLSSGHLFADLHGEGLLAAVLLQGTGYGANDGASGVDLGVGGGLRVAYRFGRIAPFIGLSLAGWLRPQQVHVSGLAQSLTLPQLEVLLSVGGTWLIFVR